MKIAFLHEDDANCSEWRCIKPGTVLAQRGHEVSQYNIYKDWPAELLDYDIVVVQRPTDPKHLEQMQFLINNGVPVVVEIDDLFTNGALQPDNPAYFIFHPKVISTKGALGEWQFQMMDHEVNKKRETLLKSIKMADALCTTTSLISDAYGPIAKKIYVLPNCWDATNPEWTIADKNRPLYFARQSMDWTKENDERPKSLRSKPEDNPFLSAQQLDAAKIKDEIWVLFSGSFTHLADFRLVESALRDVLKTHPNVRFAVGGDPRIQTEVAKIPDDQYVFLGSRKFDQYPQLLSQADIILAPLKDTVFNKAKSDIRLMEAGVLGIPWIASPVPTYKTWNVGGLFASKNIEWQKQLSRLIEMTPEQRSAVAAVAREKAVGRSIQANIEKWERAYVEVIQKVSTKRRRIGLEGYLQSKSA